MKDPKTIPSLRAQLIQAAHQFSIYLPEPLEPEDCDQLMHIMGALVLARERTVWLEAQEAVNALMGKDCGNWNRAIVYAVAELKKQAEEVGK